MISRLTADDQLLFDHLGVPCQGCWKTVSVCWQETYPIRRAGVVEYALHLLCDDCGQVAQYGEARRRRHRHGTSG
jgi:hypothetical protein